MSNSKHVATLDEDQEAVRRALAAGDITVADRESGYRRSIYALCPRDGQRATVWRAVRGADQAITELTVHCSRCGNEFVATVDGLRLR